MLRSASIAVVSLLLLSACPKQAAEKAELEAEIAEAEAALRATTTEQALLKIARHQDARRDVVELYPLRRHTDPVVRAAVTRALGLIGDPDAAGAIAGSLQDRDPRVRSEAAFALSRMPSWRATDLEAGTGPAEAEQWILEALEEELADAPSTGDSVPSSDGVRRSPTPLRAYARALGEIGQKDGAEALWALVRDTSRAPEVRAEALLALGIQARRGVAEPPLTEEEIAALAPLLIEKKPAVQWPAAYLISRAGVVPEAREKADGVLGIGWKSAEDADVRAWFLRALGKVAGPSAEVILADATSPDRPLRERIGACRGAAAGKLETVLTRLLEDPEAMIRDEAVAGLGRIGSDETFALLVDRVDHPAALSALAGYLEREGSPATEGRLEVILNAALAATETEDPKLRQAAYGLLGAHPSQSALEALLERVAVADGFTKVTESHPSAALYLAVAISERAEPAVEGALLGWLDGPDSLYGAVAADGLSEREGGHVTTRLAEALERFSGPEEAERRLAIVKALAARENTVTILLKASLDDDGLVREAAADASRKQVGIASSESRTEPRLRDFPELKDGFWGVGDVTGAVLETSRGTITLDLYPGVAPGTVANFVSLAETGYFNGLLFHRVVPDFVIQGGDPLGTGWGGPGHTIRCENSSVDYVRGTLGMALSGKDTGGSQWFITHTPQPHLTGHYTVFGQMTDGWDVLDAVRVGDTIDAVTIVR